MSISCVNSCKIPLPLIWKLLNEFFVMSEAHYILGFILLLALLLSLYFLMQIEPVTQLIENPLLAYWSSLALAQFRGLPGNNPQSLVPPLKLSVVLWLSLLQNWLGFVRFSGSFICVFLTSLFFGVTTILPLPSFKSYVPF